MTTSAKHDGPEAPWADNQALGAIRIGGPSLRSVNLERDLRSAELEPIFVSGRAQDTLSRIAAAIEDSTRTRAWSLTGPYGSGKSTLALLIDALLGEPGNRRNQAEQLLASASPALAQRISVARDHYAPGGFITAAAVARREPFAKTLTRALVSSANRRWRSGRLPRRIAAAMRPLGISGAGSEEFLAALAALCGESPVLLIIDEFGKTLEYLAAKPDAAADEHEDMFLLQELAEASAGSAGMPAYTLTLQHLSFLDYASHSGVLQRREWAKIQGRFEDITYGPDLGDAVRLIRSCISHGDVAHPGRQLIAKHGTASAAAWSGLGLDGLLPADAGVFAGLYPLHPLTAAVAPLLAAQIGQHDRTLTGFLANDEPHTVQRFLLREPVGAVGRTGTVRLPQLYDYFFASGRTTMLASASAGRWIEIDLVLSQAHGLGDQDLRILKTVALLNLIDAAGALRASPAMVLFALSDPAEDDETARKTLLVRLDALVERGFLVYREFSDEYRIWQGTDVDLRARISEARERCDDHAVVRMLSKHLPAAVVAGRHSQRTGMLRHFITAATDATTGVIHGPVIEDPADGILIFHFGDEADTPAVESPLPAVVGTSGNARTVLDAGRELLALSELASADGLDAVARREVKERAGQAQARLAAVMAEAFRPAQLAARWQLLSGQQEQTDPEGAQRGRVLTGRSMAAIVSAACDIAYPDTPHIRNEMLGRHQLTSQGAKARRELITAMITRPSESVLGIEGYGPERAMYLGALAYLGLHGPASTDSDRGVAHYRFTEPGPASSLAPAWKALQAALARASREWPLDEATRLLMAPPYGVKAGAVPVIVVAALILATDDVAVFEEGTYQPRLTPELVERLIKNPSRFSVKSVPLDAGPRHTTVQCLASELGISTAGRWRAADRNAAMLSIARELLDRVRGLSGYAMRTRRLSDPAIRVRDALIAARDPDDLLFAALPQAVGVEPVTPEGDRNYPVASRYAQKLAAAAEEISHADAALRDEVTAILAQEFELPTDLASLRRALATRVAGFADAVLEPELRGFIALAANDSLADDDWLDPVAVRVAHAGLASWTDDHLTVFRSGCRKLAGSLDRFSDVYYASVTDSEVWLITITTPDGDEKRILAHMTALVRATADALAASAIRAADRELGPVGRRALLAALTEALCTPGEAVGSDYDQPAPALLQRETAAQLDHDSAR